MYQLRKLIKLPFSVSNYVVSNLFNIINFELWASPITSVSGLWHYVIFLDHFSCFLWVYPLKQKSDVFYEYIKFPTMSKLNSAIK